MSAVADVLNQAADLIERDGWWCRTAPSRRGWDITGAVGSAAHSAVEYAESLRALRFHLGVEGVAAWNNAPGRTKAEVIAALRAAAGRASAPVMTKEQFDEESPA